jgi:hypothetical protein
MADEERAARKPSSAAAGGARDSDSPRRPWLPLVPMLLLLAMFIATAFLGPRATALPSISYTSFYDLVEQGKVERVLIEGQSVELVLKSREAVEGAQSQRFQTTLPSTTTSTSNIRSLASASRPSRPSATQPCTRSKRRRGGSSRAPRMRRRRR